MVAVATETFGNMFHMSYFGYYYLKISSQHCDCLCSSSNLFDTHLLSPTVLLTEIFFSLIFSSVVLRFDHVISDEKKLQTHIDMFAKGTSEIQPRHCFNENNHIHKMKHANPSSSSSKKCKSGGLEEVGCNSHVTTITVS